MAKRKPRVLVTGGAGFIGSHTADLLKKHGYKIRIFDNLSSKTHSGSWPAYLDKEYERFLGDVRYKTHWKNALDGVDYVIHLAAWMDLLPEFSQFSSTNSVGTANLYEVIVKENLPIKKVVVASSQFVYGQGQWKCEYDDIVCPADRDEEHLQNGDWDPKCPVCGRKIRYLWNRETFSNPPNQYAITKLNQEQMALTLGKLYGVPSSAMRYSIVHGARQTLKNAYSGALRIFTLQMMANQDPSIFEDGKQKRDYVHVKDVAGANLAVLESDKTNFKQFNVGSGKSYTVLQLAQMIKKSVGSKSSIKPNGMYRVGDTRHSVSNISRLKSLGWRPEMTEEQAIEDFVHWVLTQDNSAFANTKKVNKQMLKSGVLKKTK